MLSELLSDPILRLSLGALAGLVCSFLNTVASSGSAVSLPMLILLGLDPITANATNRIPVLVGAVTATGVFQRKRLIDWGIVLRLAPPVTLGAGVGAVLAEIVPGRQMSLVITAAILIALLLLFTKVKAILEAAVADAPRFRPREAALFFVIGAWLGFLVLDGATYLLLGLVLVAHVPLVQANAAKSVALVPTSLIALLVFAWSGLIDWRIGGAMALGSVAGGILGGRLAGSVSGKKWIFRLLVAVIVAELVHLTVQYVLG